MKFRSQKTLQFRLPFKTQSSLLFVGFCRIKNILIFREELGPQILLFDTQTEICSKMKSHYKKIYSAHFRDASSELIVHARKAENDIYQIIDLNSEILERVTFTSDFRFFFSALIKFNMSNIPRIFEQERIEIYNKLSSFLYPAHRTPNQVWTPVQLNNNELYIIREDAGKSSPFLRPDYHNLHNFFCFQKNHKFWLKSLVDLCKSDFRQKILDARFTVKQPVIVGDTLYTSMFENVFNSNKSNVTICLDFRRSNRTKFIRKNFESWNYLKEFKQSAYLIRYGLYRVNFGLTNLHSLKQVSNPEFVEKTRRGIHSEIVNNLSIYKKKSIALFGRNKAWLFRAKYPFNHIRTLSFDLTRTISVVGNAFDESFFVIKRVSKKIVQVDIHNIRSFLVISKTSTTSH